MTGAQKKPQYAARAHLVDARHLGFIEGLTYSLPSESSSTDFKLEPEVLCHFFGGIPYALPPLGPFRWKRPRALPPCYRYGTRANPGRFAGGAALCPQPGYGGPPTTKLWDEDCLQLNIWVPAGDAPRKGWPVLFFIHGGWLQFGTPNSNNLIAQLGETDLQCIVVCPAYRLNLFGFLASRELEQEASAAGEPVGNYGFWDQRLALEWTWKNISCFGGDVSNITVAGYSAGAHSTFQQLSYDIYLPAKKRIIKRAIMHSNGPGMQPKTVSSLQDQFDSLLSALHIPLNLSASDKLAKLRALPAHTLVAANDAISLHEFRACSDGTFISKDIFREIDSGAYAAKLRDAGVQLLIGECQDENFVYQSWRAPKDADGLKGLRERLYADYPPAAVDELLDRCYCPDGKLPTWKPAESWPGAFGYVYADLQVHAFERGFVDCLARGGAADSVHRYRVEWRAECCDTAFPKDWGVTHGTDMAIWFWGNGMGAGLRDDEKKVARKFRQPFVDFVLGKKMNWEAHAPNKVRRLKSNGEVDLWEDEDWERGLGVWKVARAALTKAEGRKTSKI